MKIHIIQHPKKSKYIIFLTSNMKDFSFKKGNWVGQNLKKIYTWSDIVLGTLATLTESLNIFYEPHHSLYLCIKSFLQAFFNIILLQSKYISLNNWNKKMCQVSVILPFCCDINDQKIKENSGMDNVHENLQLTTNILFSFIYFKNTYMFINDYWDNKSLKISFVLEYILYCKYFKVQHLAKVGNKLDHGKMIWKLK